VPAAVPDRAQKHTEHRSPRVLWGLQTLIVYGSAMLIAMTIPYFSDIIGLIASLIASQVRLCSALPLVLVFGLRYYLDLATRLISCGATIADNLGLAGLGVSVRVAQEWRSPVQYMGDRRCDRDCRCGHAGCWYLGLYCSNCAALFRFGLRSSVHVLTLLVCLFLENRLILLLMYQPSPRAVIRAATIVHNTSMPIPMCFQQSYKANLGELACCTRGLAMVHFQDPQTKKRWRREIGRGGRGEIGKGSSGKMMSEVCGRKRP
jgi:hypothetical protein